MQLLFARHGHPDYATDSLTAQGHIEAAALARALDGYPLDAIYVSTMGRARETAAYTLERRGQEGVLCDWLQEVDGRYGYPEAEPPPWAPGDPRASAYEIHPADLFARPRLYSYEDWHDEVPYGPWLRPRFDALQRAFDALLAEHGYERRGLRYQVQESNEGTLAFFCHDGVIRGLLSHLLYIPLPTALALFCHNTTGLTLLRSIEGKGQAVFGIEFLNNTAHKRDGSLSHL